MSKATKDQHQYERKFAGPALAEVDSDGTFSGYASIFDAPDLGAEIVAKGAFKNSIRKKGAAGIKLLFQHNPDEPIGRWLDIREDNKGLFVKGQLNLDVARAREVHSLMRSGSIDGLSIGFKTLKAKRQSNSQMRLIQEADLWEISIVTFPMLPQARVERVKAQTLPTTREFEHWLVRDAGLTRSQARTVIVKGFASLERARDAASTIKTNSTNLSSDLVGKIRQATQQILSQ